MPEIALEEVSLDNLRDVTNLKVADHQKGFVADNTQSIAWSRYLPNLIPTAVHADGTLVGFALYGSWGGEKPGLWGIARFMIDEHHQGKGYGKAAMHTILQDIKQRDPGVRGVVLSYVPENDSARKLYASVGFRETGEMWGHEVAAQYDYPGAHNGREG
jgi:diamine N-acetyltransferase